MLWKPTYRRESAVNGRAHVFAAMLVALIATVSCAGAPLSPAEMALRRVARTASAWSNGVRGILRYNPTRCQCPEFELMVDNAWYRVELTNDVGQDPAMVGLYSDALKSGPGWSIPVIGTSKGVQKQRFRSPVIRFQIDSICRDGECQPAPDSISNEPGSTQAPGEGILP